MMIAAPMGDPNASIPTPQPVHYRPMFGAFGKALQKTSLTFVSQVAMDEGLKGKLGCDKEFVAVQNVRGGISKKSLIHNDATTPHITVNPETYEVRADASFSCASRWKSSDGAALFPVLTPLRPQQGRARRQSVAGGGRAGLRSRPRLGRTSHDLCHRHAEGQARRRSRASGGCEAPALPPRARRRGACNMTFSSRVTLRRPLCSSSAGRAARR